MHNKLAYALLYNATVSNIPPTNVQFQAFLSGFELGCVNGFKLTAVGLNCAHPSIVTNIHKAIHSFPGGANGFLQLVSLSHVSGASSITNYLEITSIPAGARVELQSILAPTHAVVTPFLSLVWERFINGHGVPIAGQRWDDAKLHFHPLLDLAGIDEESFRSRSLVWATTGSPELKPTIVEGREKMLVSQPLLDEYYISPSSS